MERHESIHVASQEVLGQCVDRNMPCLRESGVINACGSEMKCILPIHLTTAELSNGNPTMRIRFSSNMKSPFMKLIKSLVQVHR